MAANAEDVLSEKRLILCDNWDNCEVISKFAEFSFKSTENTE